MSNNDDMKPNDTDQFLREPDEAPTPSQRRQMDILVNVTAQNLMNATAEQVERALANIVKDPTIEHVVGPSLLIVLPKNIRAALAKMRRK